MILNGFDQSPTRLPALLNVPLDCQMYRFVSVSASSGLRRHPDGATASLVAGFQEPPDGFCTGVEGLGVSVAV